jgi:hypothetical protein
LPSRTCHDRGPIPVPGAHLDLNCLEPIQEVAQFAACVAVITPTRNAL